MPLLPNALLVIRKNLEDIATGRKVAPVTIGDLTGTQLSAINKARLERKNHLGQPAPFAPITGEVIFFGQHIHNRRIVQHGYTIEDVLDMINSAMSAASQWIPTSRGTILQNKTPRIDHYGNSIRDEAVLECMRKHPRAELYSVIPKGDGKGGD